MKTINELLNDALFAWVDLTGVKLDQTSFTFTLDGGSDYHLHDATKELNKSRDLDETGLTTWMMLRGMVEQYLQSQKFSAYSLIFDPDPIKERLASMRHIHAALESSLVVELIEEFVTKIREAAILHKFEDMEGLEKLLAKKLSLAHIRRDALLSMERLNAHQFMQGAGDPVQIRMNPNVYEVWNINSLVRMLRGQTIPGITTVLVRDPQALHSFFVFAVKNGDNITVLTDKDDDVHPAYKRMSRRPDRQLIERAEKHWFPYQLLDLHVTDDGRELFDAPRTTLVPINTSAVKLAGINALTPSQFVWFLLISELIRDKFWKDNFHTPELAYTGEMVQEPHSLVGQHSALIKSGQYAPLVLEPLQPADVTTESTASQWQRPPICLNEWMVVRYSGDVPADVLNVIGDNAQLLIEDKHGLADIDAFRERTPFLERLDPQDFGTRDHMMKNRLWAARVNQMKMVQQLAWAEYKKTKDELSEWYAAAIRERAEFFVEAAIRGELLAPVAGMLKPNGEHDHWSGNVSRTTENVMKDQIIGKYFGGLYAEDFRSLGDSKIGSVSIVPPVTERAGRRFDYYYPCYDRPDLKANVFTMFSPNCAEALALFLGIKLEELPWQLRHWLHEEIRPYTGNQILNRLDPVDWVLRNPWRKMRFTVGIGLSKMAYNARRKALGLPPKEIIRQVPYGQKYTREGNLYQPGITPESEKRPAKR